MYKKSEKRWSCTDLVPINWWVSRPKASGIVYVAGKGMR